MRIRMRMATLKGSEDAGPKERMRGGEMKVRRKRRLRRRQGGRDEDEGRRVGGMRGRQGGWEERGGG